MKKVKTTSLTVSSNIEHLFSNKKFNLTRGTNAPLTESDGARKLTWRYARKMKNVWIAKLAEMIHVIVVPQSSSNCAMKNSEMNVEECWLNDNKKEQIGFVLQLISLQSTPNLRLFFNLFSLSHFLLFFYPLSTLISV